MCVLDLVLRTPCAGCGGEAGRRLCAACRRVGSTRLRIGVDGIDSAVVVGRYDGPLARAIRTCKYGPDRGLGGELAALFGRRLSPVLRGDAADAIVPVPSPWTRRAVRGFSLATLLAEALAAHLDVPVVHALRLAPGARQAGRTAAERAGNLRHRLRAVVPLPGTALLVDDVVTTGATAAACARELLGGDTRRVRLAALCIASPPSRNVNDVRKF